MKNSIIFKFSTALLLCILSISTAYAALTLSQAKAQGLIGEQADGYVGAIQQKVPANVSLLIKQVNKQRQLYYQAIAETHHTSLKKVQVIAGREAYKRTAKGNYVQSPDGRWLKK